MANTFSMFTGIITPFIDVCLPVCLSVWLSVWYWYTYNLCTTRPLRSPLASDSVDPGSWVSTWPTHSQRSLGSLLPSSMYVRLSVCLSSVSLYVCLVLIYIFSLYNKVAKVTSGLSSVYSGSCISRWPTHSQCSLGSLLPYWCLSICPSVWLCGIEIHIFLEQQGW